MILSKQALSLAQLVRHDSISLKEALNLDERAARLEIQVLLCHALNVPRSHLVSHDRDFLNPQQEKAYRALLTLRLGGEPIAYIVGKREFYGLEFKVTPAVLIPRPETELLVELALDRMPQQTACCVLDLGTGSGAVAVALAKHRPLASVTAVDQSGAALAVARENAAFHGVKNLRLLQSNWFEALVSEQFDLIVSNPPYVAAEDVHLQQGDARFEPQTALASGADGLDDIRAIVAQAPLHLKPGGWLLFEHGYDQQERCQELLQSHGFTQVATAIDLAGIPRVSYGKRAS